MNKEEVYKYYDWNPSDGDYKTPIYDEEVIRHKFSFYAIRIYHKLLRVITLKFF